MWFPTRFVAGLAIISFLMLSDPVVRAEERDPPAIPPQTKLFQQLLFEKTGLIAKSATDAHAPLVLTSLLTILQAGLPPQANIRLQRLKYLYAYRSFKNGPAIAYYDEKNEAINIGGISVYRGDDEGPVVNDTLLTTLAHELGHALIFSRLTPNELVEIGVKFGGWPASRKKISSFYDPQLFVEHPQCQIENPPPLVLGYLPTPYSCHNIHEWFSEVFASMIINRLAKAGKLGDSHSTLPQRYIKPPKALADKIDSLLKGD